MIDDRVLRVVLAAVADRWPVAAGALASDAMLQRLVEAKQQVPPQRLNDALEGLQGRGLLRLSRGFLNQEGSDTHGARVITWVDPVALVR